MPHYLYTGNHRGLTPMEVMMDIFARQQAKPFFLVLIRLVVMAALALAAYGVFRVTGISRDFPPTDTIYEAYSAAGKTWFGWWLVEHYFSYHIDCPDGCDSGEPARGRKDPPYFQMSYGSLDNIPDLVDPLVESPLPVQ